MAGPSVLQVVLSLATGGTERLVVDICTRLQPRFQMAVCCLDESGRLGDELTNRGIEVVALRRAPGFHPSLGHRIARLAARRRAAVVHCHHYSPFVYGRVATLLTRHLKLVFTEHGRLSDGPPSRKRRLVNPVLGRLPGSIYSVSSALRDSMVAEGFPSGRIEVIHNGVDPGPRPTDADRRAARAALGIVGDTFVVGTVGRLDPVKHLGDLIDAFARLRLKVADSFLLVIGDGEQRRHLETRAQQLGVAQAVHFLGDRSDVRRLLPAFDVFVNSSISEGVSLTILEAMATGLPVVATAVGGTPEVVTDRITGILVPARDPAALTSALVGLKASPERRQALGGAARRTVETRFTIDGMVERYAQIYSRLAN